MRFLTKCIVCGREVWAKGTDEPETNSCEIDRFLDSTCLHVSEGGDFSVIFAEDEDHQPELHDD